MSRFVVSTQIDIGVNRAAIVRSYPTRRLAGPEVDPDIKIWQAMKATSAAPRYITSTDGVSRRNVIEPGLVDYGTAKNNPIKDLEYECRKLYSYANDTRIIVSIGTGSGFDRHRESMEMANGIDVRSAKAQTTGEHFEEDNRNLIESGWMKYFRFNVPDLENVPLEEWKEVNRIMEKTHAYLGSPEVGQSFYACVDAIAGLLGAEQQS